MREEIEKEFDRQMARMLDVGFAKHAGMSKEGFTELVEPLRVQLHHVCARGDDTIPFVIVVKGSVVPAQTIMPSVEAKGATGEVRMTPLLPEDFSPIEYLRIPEGNAYLLLDIVTGRESLNITPHEAMAAIIEADRFPLTIDEGVALALHFPEVLTDRRRFNCFSMLGSRRNDQRVPALWVSYGKPRLGWCWENNPHTWLGSASCSARLGLVQACPAR